VHRPPVQRPDFRQKSFDHNSQIHRNFVITFYGHKFLMPLFENWASGVHGDPKKVSHCQVLSLIRIKNRH